jgi:hypothetical protein
MHRRNGYQGLRYGGAGRGGSERWRRHRFSSRLQREHPAFLCTVCARVIEGVLGIQAGTNPGLMERMLDGFVAGHNRAKTPVADKAEELPPANVPQVGRV